MNLDDLPLPPQTQTALRNAHLHTASQLLSLPPETLCHLTQLPFPTIQHTLRLLHNTISARTRPLPVPAAPIPTNAHLLDAGLGGGIQPGNITQLAGRPACGKTQLALSVAANALRMEQGVVWLDAGTGAAEICVRLERMLIAQGCDVEAARRMLRLVMVVGVGTFDRARAAVRAVGRDVGMVRVFGEEGDVGYVVGRVGVVVYDGVGRLGGLFGVRGDDGWTGIVGICEIGTGLREIAVRGCAVVVVNRMVGAGRAALGNWWRGLVDTTVFCEAGRNGAGWKVVSKRGAGSEGWFQVCEAGVRDG